jgi:hypothetical protein
LGDLVGRRSIFWITTAVVIVFMAAKTFLSDYFVAYLIFKLVAASAYCATYQAGLPDFSWSKHTKTGKIYQMTTNYTNLPCIIPNGRKIFQIFIKYNNILHSKASKIYLNLGFWFENKPSGNPATRCPKNTGVCFSQNKIAPWSQSYDHELQRQLRKKLQSN